MVLGLDFATITGWAVLDKSYIEEKEGETISTSQKYSLMGSGVVTLGEKGREWRDARYLAFWELLHTILTDYPRISLITYEHILNFGVNKSWQADCGAYSGLIVVFAKQFNIERSFVPPNTLKKFITGDGRAEKSKVIDWINKHGYPTTDDNEADAIGLAWHGIHHRDLKTRIIK